MFDFFYISVGAIVGANARYGVSRLAAQAIPSSFPVGTLLINISGSLLIGVVLTLLTERLLLDPQWRLLLVVGFIGSYTTMSSYVYESILLFEQSSRYQSIAYAVGTNLLCLVACYGGIMLGRMVR